MFKEALINSSMNYQSTNKVKCDFTLFFIFNGLPAIENGGTSMCRRNSELIRVSLGVSACFLVTADKKADRRQGATHDISKVQS